MGGKIFSMDVNIPFKIQEFARVSGLSWICTGGGIDYVGARLTEKREYPYLILGSKFDSASSPRTLSEPSLVTMFFDVEWMESVSWDFETALEAMIFMGALTKNKYWNGGE
jgi:hypothetical protein